MRIIIQQHKNQIPIKSLILAINSGLFPLIGMSQNCRKFLISCADKPNKTFFVAGKFGAAAPYAFKIGKRLSANLT